MSETSIKPDRRNILSSSLYRIMYLLKIVEQEEKYLFGFKIDSGIRNALARALRTHEHCITDVQGRLKNTGVTIERELIEKDDKVRSIGVIHGYLVAMPLEEVEFIEKQLVENIKIVYTIE